MSADAPKRAPVGARIAYSLAGALAAVLVAGAVASREAPKATTGVAAASTPAAPAAGTQGSEAKSILKAMSDYVGSLKTIEITFDSDIEVITPQLEKIQFTNSGNALLSRPDKLHATRVGGYAEMELFFDGKTASVFGKSLNGYAQFEAPGTVDKLFEALRAGHGVALPFADLLLSNSYDVLAPGVEEAKYIGRGVIHGTECEHLAFRNFDTDWQLWVEMGKAPFPRKMVITSKTVAGAPQYTLSVRSWKTGVEPARNAFTFTPPPGSKKLDPNDLIDLDELPQGAPRGSNP